MYGELKGKDIANTEFETFKTNLDKVIPLDTLNINSNQAIQEYTKTDKKSYKDIVDMMVSDDTSPRYAFGKPMDYKPEKFSWTTKNYNIGELYEELSDGSLYKKFDTYTPGINNYEDHAQKQGTLEKWYNGVTKFVDTANVSIVGGTVGAIYGVGAAIKEGRFASLYDNDFTKELDLHQEKMRLDYSHYKTIDEQNNSFLENLGTANFWTDDVAQGLAFTTGALATEAIWAWATGGTSLSTIGARLGTKTLNVVSKLGKVADKTADASRYLDDMLRVGKEAKTALVSPATNATTKVLSKLNQTAVQGGILGGRLGEGANVVRGMITSAGYEAGFEARAFMNEARRDFMSTYEKENGTKPSKEEIADFEDKLSSTANGLFAYNMAIVGSSNLAQFGNVMRIKLPKMPFTDTLNKKIFGVGTEIVEGAVKKINPTRLQKISQIGYSLGKGAITEGAWEEGMQAVGNHTAETLIKSSYDKKTAKENYDLSKAFFESLAETYTTKEGLNEVFTGMVVGALTGNVMGMYQTYEGGNLTLNHEFSDANKRNELIEKTFSQGNYSSKVAIENMIMANRVLQSKKAEENSERKGDLLGGEMARGTSLFANFSRANNLNYLDEHAEQLTNQIDLLSDQDIAKQQNISLEQAKELKDSMKEELKTQLKSFKRFNELSGYVIGNSVSKEELDVAIKKYKEQGIEIDSKLLKKELTGQLKEALTYELYMGETSYKHGEDMLKTFLNETQNILGSDRIKRAMTIEDVINKSTASTRRNLLKTRKELQITKQELSSLDKQQKELEVVVSNSRTPEAKQEALGRLNELVVKRDELLSKEQELTNNWNTLYNSAKLENPYNKIGEEYLTYDDIDTAEKTIQNTLNAIDQLPYDTSVRLKTLLNEYNKALSATKKYSERTKQMMSPATGALRTKGVFGKILYGKTPRQSTIEMIQGLLDTHFDQNKVEKEAFNNATKQIAQIKPQGVSIREVKTEKSLNLVEYIKEQIKNNPYIFEQIGEDFQDAIPTEGEIQEFYDFYEKNEIEQQPLTEEEKARYEELKNKLANWQLMESMEFEGVSLIDLIEQQATLEQNVEKVVSDEYTDEDLEIIQESINDEDLKERRFEVIQTPAHVFIQKKGDEVIFSHLTTKGILELLGQKSVEVTRGDKTETVSIEDINDFVDNNDIISFGNTRIKYIRGGRIVMYEEDFNSLNIKTKMSKSGYSLVYDAQGKPMKSDFKDVDTYSSQEISKLKNGDELTLIVDLEDDYNNSLLSKSDEEFFDNLKISLVDSDGNKVGDLKANYQAEGFDTDETFLEIRKKAVEIVKNSTELQVTIGFLNVSNTLLGSPNIELQPGTSNVVSNTIVTELVEDYGYWDGEKLITRNNIKARTDFVKDLKKKVPIVVIKNGNNLIAYPVSLNKVDKMLGDEIMSRNLPKAQLATEINKELKKNGIDSNLFFISSENTNMFQPDGKTSEQLENAIEQLNKLQDKVDYTKEWFNKEHTKNNLLDEVSIDINMNKEPFISPKLVVDFSTWTEMINTVEIISKKTFELISLKNQILNLGKKDALLLSDNTLKFEGATFKFVVLDGELFTQPISNSKWIDSYLKSSQEEEKNYFKEKVKTLTTNRGSNFLDKYGEVYSKIAELESDPFIKDEYDSWSNMNEQKQEEALKHFKC